MKKIRINKKRKKHKIAKENTKIKEKKIKKSKKMNTIGKKIFSITVSVTIIAMLILLSINVLIFRNLLNSIEKDVLSKGKNIKGSIS
ncbi:hypothetical protein A500_05346, partial [Clostridium sartagoforme AAU1]